MRANEFLIERVVNAFTAQDKHPYADEVWAILQKSYAAVPGGFGTADSVEELINKSALWKIVRRAGKITAIGIYKDQHGRKSIAAGTDGTAQGKRDYMMIKTADISHGRAWAEVSGAPEAILKRSGALPLPNKFAGILTGKQILELNPDGIHYTREIGGAAHEKAIYGTVDLSPELVAQLTAAGVALHEFPNFKS